ALCGLAGAALGGWLFRRGSSFPKWISQRCDSIDRLSRRGFYLDEVASLMERSVVFLTQAWRAADTPMLGSERRTSLPAEGANHGVAAGDATNSETMVTGSAGWSVAAVLFTALV